MSDKNEPVPVPVPGPLPMIFKREAKLTQGGQIMEERQLTIQGPNLKECKRIFDEEWGKK